MSATILREVQELVARAPSIKVGGMHTSFVVPQWISAILGYQIRAAYHVLFAYSVRHLAFAAYVAP